jgi:hypothetical protein
VQRTGRRDGESNFSGAWAGIHPLAFGRSFTRIQQAKETALNNKSSSGWLLLSAGFGLCIASVAFPFLSRLHAAPQQASPSRVSSIAESRGFSLIAASPAFSAQDLSAPPAKNWLKNGGTLFNQNWSPLKQINRESVSNLKAVWQTHLDGSGLPVKYSGEAQPVVYEASFTWLPEPTTYLRSA